MSLIEQMMEECTLYEKRRVPDGEGGFDVEWVESEPFMAVIGHDNSMQARLAESQGVKSVYTITTHRNVALDYHDIIKRADGKILRVTSHSGEEVSPRFSSINMAQVTAENWELA